MTTSEVTEHLTTNADVIARFAEARIAIEGGKGEPGRVVVDGVG
jgi:RNA 3'-terminal phosphate cyclase